MPEVPHHDPIPLTWMGTYDELPDGEYQVGWAFFLRRDNGLLSKHYHQVVAAVRPPICVICPGAVRADGTLRGTTFIIDDHPTDQPDGGLGRAGRHELAGHRAAAADHRAPVHPSRRHLARLARRRGPHQLI